MKRKDLLDDIKKLAKANNVVWKFDGHGSNHDKYLFNGKMVPIPRHKEIGEGLVSTIMKQCKSTLEEGDE